MGVLVRLCLCLALVFLGGCASVDINPSALASKITEYQISENRYAIIVAQGDEVKNMEEAKKVAYQKAAEFTVAHKARYFYVVSEEKVQMSAVQKPSEDRPPPSPRGNYYQQKEVKEVDFVEDSLDGVPRAGKESLGYKVIFEIYEAKSFGRRYVDACDLTKCP